jgi:hypothetical protein
MQPEVINFIRNLWNKYCKLAVNDVRILVPASVSKMKDNKLVKNVLISCLASK